MMELRESRRSGEIIPPTPPKARIEFRSDRFTPREMVDILLGGIKISYDPDNNESPVILEYPLLGEVTTSSND